MPKNKIKKKMFSEKLFKAILNARNYNITTFYEENYGFQNTDKFGNEYNICSERTLRRSFNAGKIQKRHAEAFAFFLDVDTRFLTGELIKNNLFEILNNEERLNEYLSLIDKYPFLLKKQRELQQDAMKSCINNILSLFDLTYNQFELLSLEKKSQLEYTLYENIASILSNYFQTDCFGNAGWPALIIIPSEVKDYYDKKLLRQKMIVSPPTGYTSKDIERMSDEEIDILDYALWYESEQHSLEKLVMFNYLKHKYSQSTK